MQLMICIINCWFASSIHNLYTVRIDLKNFLRGSSPIRFFKIQEERDRFVTYYNLISTELRMQIITNFVNYYDINGYLSIKFYSFEHMLFMKRNL